MKRSKWIIGGGLAVIALVPFFAVHAADTTKPTFQSFSTTTPKGIYGAGVRIPITARYSEGLRADSSLVVALNTIPEQKVVLNTVSSAGSVYTVSGTYIVTAGDRSDKLRVTRITTESVKDLAGNVRTNTGVSSYSTAHNLDERSIGRTSPVFNRIIGIDTAAPVAPVASVAGGTYPATKIVRLSVPNEPSSTKIYYTLNGTNPTVTSTKYSSSLTIRATTTLKAIARDAGGNISPMLVAVYVIGSATPTPTPTQTPTQTVVPTRLTCHVEGLVGDSFTGYPVGQQAKISATLEYKDNQHPIPNATVDWSMREGTNGLAASSSITNNDGVVTNMFTMPAGSSVVRASYRGPSVIDPETGRVVYLAESSCDLYFTSNNPNPYDGQTITPIPTPTATPTATPIPTPEPPSVAEFSSPALNSIFAQLQNIPITVSGTRNPTCGVWTLVEHVKHPDGTRSHENRTILTASDFAANELPGGLPACTN